MAGWALGMCLAFAGAISGEETANGDETTVVLRFSEPETAGISGFREYWNRPIPGSRDFDAVHRSLLVRFPDVAQRLADKLVAGYAVETVELVLPHERTELYTAEAGYHQRLSFGSDELYKAVPPRWHAVGWALRRPWVADPQSGPTFNAAVNGRVPWSRYGAQDETHDRFPARFGPVEVSGGPPPPPVAAPQRPDDSQALGLSGLTDELRELLDEEQLAELLSGKPPDRSVHGRLDVTDTLRDTVYGATLADRLRRLSDCGFLVRKWEEYDWRFRVSGQGAYEWAVATGGRGIRSGPPELVVTLVPVEEPQAPIRVPSAPVLTESVGDLAGAPPAGKPVTTLVDDDALADLARRLTAQQPDWMPEWQWARVSELFTHGPLLLPDTPSACAAWIDRILADPPRYWNGFDAADRLLIWYLYESRLPDPVRDHIMQYWSSWLMPDRDTQDLDHPQAIELQYGGRNRYFEETGDWRGNASFYRAGYTRHMSTMNFNHTAALGALLGGRMIGSEAAMADGRHGLEHFPLRLWAWYDGSTQESIDHYYFAITVSAQKMFADLGPTVRDRLMGRSALTKSMDELMAAYHPGLRRFLSASSRTTYGHIMVTQEGLQHIIHTLSHSGALTDTDRDTAHGLPVFGHDAPPARIAQQTMLGPWDGEWVAPMVDDKPVPSRFTAAFKMWGGHANDPLWKRTYLGRHYGVASQDRGSPPNPVVAHWRHTAEQVERSDELVTMTVRPGRNHVNLITTEGGGLGAQGRMVTLQHDNILLVLTSPGRQSGPEGVDCLQTALGLFTFRASPDWTVYVDREPVNEWPREARQTQRIVVHDGVTYLGVIPLPATDLGRDIEVLISTNAPRQPFTVQDRIRSSAGLAPALTIESFHLYRPGGRPPETAAPDQPEIDVGLGSDIDAGLTDWIAEMLDPRIEQIEALRETIRERWSRHDRAAGGFVIRLADAAEFESPEAFMRHLDEAELRTEWDDDTALLSVVYREADTELRAGYDARRGAFTERTVNGAWPYLEAGIDRDGTFSQQGTRGWLEKHGATLRAEPGRMMFLRAEPAGRIYEGWNPLPDPTFWSLTLPDGMTLTADGRLGIARVSVALEPRRLDIEYAGRDDDVGEAAGALIVTGIATRPMAMVNGEDVTDRMATLELDGQPAFAVPLHNRFRLPGVADRLAVARNALTPDR